MPDKNNILLISYYFPPLALGGVKRPYALYKYLPEYSYDVTVLTVKNIFYPEYDYSRRLSGFENPIIRTGSFDPARLMYLLGFRRQKRSTIKLPAQTSLFFPDSKKGWIWFALRAAKKVIEDYNISAIITSSPPPSAHIIGMKLKDTFNIPWIADFRDFWFSLPIEKVYSSPDQILKAEALKKSFFDKADELVCVNNGIRNYLGRGEVIMNGAEIDDTKSWRSDRKRDDAKFIVGILGTINYLCPIEPLFKAINLLIRENSSLKDNFSILHVGNIDRESINLIDKYDLHDNVSLHGYLPAKTAIEVLSGSDMLYLSVNEFDNYHILPGRIFDYLVSGLPILGVVPEDSDAAALLNEYKYGKVVQHGAIEKMSQYIINIYENRNNIRQRTETGHEINYKYSTEAMAEKYARLLDRILS